MKISVITWDADFREHLHTIDFFARQNLEDREYEFLWVDFYASNDRVREKISHHENMRLITLDHEKSRKWHLGKCINEGVARARGDLLVIPDGDIAVGEDFLSRVLANHRGLNDLVVYHKRFDEPRESSCDLSRTSLDHLRTHSKLINPTNYAGCLTLRRETFSRINGYETHEAFAGPGINGMETYIRLRNAGCLIKWEPEVRIYHPWHPSSGNAGHDRLELLRTAKANHPWIIPYAGLEQSWIIHRREMLGETLATKTGCDQLLAEMPPLDSFRESAGKKSRSTLGSLLHFLRT